MHVRNAILLYNAHNASNAKVLLEISFAPDSAIMLAFSNIKLLDEEKASTTFYVA